MRRSAQCTVRAFRPRAPKPECHHIALIKANPSYGAQEAKKIVLANVREVTGEENGALLTPLVPLGDPHFSLAVACDLARLRVSLSDVAKYLHGNRLSIAQAYIAEHGRKIYGPWSEQNLRHDGCTIVHEQTVPRDT